MGGEFIYLKDYNYDRKGKTDKGVFKGGMRVIPGALRELGYDVPVEIPRRYRRHFDIMNEEG